MNFYAQVIKVLDAPAEVNLKVGDNFDAEQNLISAVNPVTNNAIPYADLTVTSNVNTAVAGAYHVTYTYTLADGKTISITTKVKVSAKDNANNTSGTPAKKTTATKKGHLFPKTSDSTSAVSLIVLCASLTALGIVVYKRKRF